MNDKQTFMYNYHSIIPYKYGHMNDRFTFIERTVKQLFISFKSRERLPGGGES